MAIESVIEAGVSAGMNGISPEDILFEEISVDMMAGL